MTTTRSPVSLIAPVLFGVALWTSTPAAAASESEGRAVAACRTEMLSRFDSGQVRSYRVGAIAGASRATRVTLYVNAERRYEFQCAADRQGRIVTASFDPARTGDRQLAAGQR